MGGAGSDLALQAADAVVVRDDLRTIPAVLALARRAGRVVTANLGFAATVITVLVVWDLSGYLPLPLGVAGHETSTVIVGLHGLRLLSSRAWPTTTAMVNAGSAQQPRQSRPGATPSGIADRITNGSADPQHSSAAQAAHQ